MNLTKKDLTDLLEQAMIEGAEGLHLDGVIHAVEILEGWIDDLEADYQERLETHIQRQEELMVVEHDSE